MRTCILPVRARRLPTCKHSIQACTALLQAEITANMISDTCARMLIQYLITHIIKSSTLFARWYPRARDNGHLLLQHPSTQIDYDELSPSWMRRYQRAWSHPPREAVKQSGPLTGWFDVSPCIQARTFRSGIWRIEGKVMVWKLGHLLIVFLDYVCLLLLASAQHLVMKIHGLS